MLSDSLTKLFNFTTQSTVRKEIGKFQSLVVYTNPELGLGCCLLHCLHSPLLITAQILCKKLHVFDLCMCVCKYESISASVVSHLGCSLARQARTQSFILPRKLFPGDVVIDALDNQLSPTLKHIGPVIQQYFEASSHLCDGNLCAVKGGRWHFDSVSKIL